MTISTEDKQRADGMTLSEFINSVSDHLLDLVAIHNVGYTEALNGMGGTISYVARKNGISHNRLADLIIQAANKKSGQEDYS